MKPILTPTQIDIVATTLLNLCFSQIVHNTNYYHENIREDRIYVRKRYTNGKINVVIEKENICLESMEFHIRAILILCKQYGQEKWKYYKSLYTNYLLSNISSNLARETDSETFKLRESGILELTNNHV